MKRAPVKKKIQNSPCSVYKYAYSLIIFKREVVWSVRLAKTICLQYVTYNNFHKATQVSQCYHLAMSEMKTL